MKTLQKLLNTLRAKFQPFMDRFVIPGDKANHFFWRTVFLSGFLILFPWWFAGILLLLLAIGKEILDKLSGKTFDDFDIIYTILPFGFYVINKFL